MRNAAVLLAYAAVLAFGLFQTFGPVLKSGFARVQTERGDGMLNHYILEHSWQSLTNSEYRASLFSPPCFYPARSTLWYSEHLLGVAPIYWGLRIVMSFDLAYQWWQIILDAFNFVAFALVVRWLRGPHILAILGGYLWAFSLINIDQIKHQQMIPRFAMVLAAYHGWQFVLALGSTGSNPSRHLNRMMAAVFLQGITCVNTGWFLVTSLATFLPLAVCLQPGTLRSLFRYVRENRSRVASIVGGWTGALLASYIPYFVVNWGLSRGYQECIPLMPTPEAWLAGVPGTIWDGAISHFRAQVIDESLLFCGFGIDVLMLVSLVCLVVSLVYSLIGRAARRPEFVVELAALLTALIWILFTLKIETGDHSLWELVRHIPGGTAIRAVSRVYVTVYLFGVLGALMWLARVTESLRPPVRCVVLGLIVAFCMIEQYGYEPPSFEKQDFYPLVDRTAAELKKGDIGYVIPRYTDTKGAVTPDRVYGEVFGMWCGLRANVPVVNGYSGRVPDEVFHAAIAAPDVWRVNEIRRWLNGKFHGTLALVDPDHLDATVIIVIE